MFLKKSLFSKGRISSVGAKTVGLASRPKCNFPCYNCISFNKLRNCQIEISVSTVFLNILSSGIILVHCNCENINLVY